MADGTHIEWTDATWNIITGCSVVSPGCTHCYAMRLAGTRLRDHPSRRGLTTPSKSGPVWNGSLRFNAEWLDQPLRWSRPRRIFVCAHGDLFHDGVSDAWLDQIFAVMAQCPQHVFQVLTKRPARMRAYMKSLPERRAMLDCDAGLDWAPWPLPNVWLGVSVEDQARADARIPDLLATPAAVRWISAEPLLGPVDLTNLQFDKACDCTDDGPTFNALNASVYCRGCCEGPEPMTGGLIDWVVVGGESGRGARPMHPDWVRGLRDQCAASDTPFLFKQWGAWAEVPDEIGDSDVAEGLFDPDRHALIAPDGRVSATPASMPLDTPCRLIERLGKKTAGRTLDGVTHDAYPEALS